MILCLFALWAGCQQEPPERQSDRVLPAQVGIHIQALQSNPSLYWANLVLLPLGDTDFGRDLYLNSALWRTLAVASNHFVENFHTRYRDEFSINLIPFLDFHRDSAMKVPMVFMPNIQMN